MTNYQNRLKKWIYFNVLVILLPLAPFYLRFGKMAFSDHPEDWVVFSSYLSNISTPILMSCNIYFLIKLTYIVADYNEKNFGDQMRQNAYLEIVRKLYSLTIVIQTSENISRDLTLLKNDIYSFSESMNHIFNIDKLSEITDSIYDDLTEITECSFLKQGLREDDVKEYNQFIKLCENFDSNRVLLIHKLQNSILNRDEKGF